MELRIWLKQQRGRAAKLAAQIGKTRRLVDAYADGMYRDADTAASISAAAEGEVSIQEILYPNGLPAGASMCPRASNSDRTQTQEAPELPSAA